MWLIYRFRICHCRCRARLPAIAPLRILPASSDDMVSCLGCLNSHASITSIAQISPRICISCEDSQFLGSLSAARTGNCVGIPSVQAHSEGSLSCCAQGQMVTFSSIVPRHCKIHSSLRRNLGKHFRRNPCLPNANNRYNYTGTW